MGLCKDCKWWGSVFEADEMGLGEYGRCKRVASEFGSRLNVGGLAFAHDWVTEKPYTADLLTKADFGCVQFSRRPD